MFIIQTNLFLRKCKMLRENIKNINTSFVSYFISEEKTTGPIVFRE